MTPAAHRTKGAAVRMKGGGPLHGATTGTSAGRGAARRTGGVAFEEQGTG